MNVCNAHLCQLLATIKPILAQENCDAYIVGGFVRDWLSDRQTNDIDIIVNIDAAAIAKKVAQAVSGKYVLLDEVNRVARVVIPEVPQPVCLDFATFLHSVEEDLARRDFTINAMAIELNGFLSGSDYLIDPFHGKKDLKKKLLRMVNSLVFRTDAARLLRAVRLAAELKFNVDQDTERLIKEDASLVRSVAGERLRDELLKILGLPYASDYLRYLDRLHLLSEMMTGWEQMRGVEQPKEHYWDVLTHSLETVAAIEFLFGDNKWRYGKAALLEMIPWSDEIKAHFEDKVGGGSNRKMMLKTAGLLHDIAKPQVKAIDENGRMRFIGHAVQGATMAAELLGKLRFSTQEIKIVENLIYYHLRPVQMANIGLPTSRAIYRYFRDTGSDGTDILFLTLADYLAARGPNVDMGEWEQHNRLINYIITENQKQQTVFLSDKLIDGHDLMDIFGLTSGPLVGKLLRLVREMQASGGIATKDDAITFVRKKLETG
jgi:poly(A) polymerase